MVHSDQQEVRRGATHSAANTATHTNNTAANATHTGTAATRTTSSLAHEAQRGDLVHAPAQLALPPARPHGRHRHTVLAAGNIRNILRRRGHPNTTYIASTATGTTALPAAALLLQLLPPHLGDAPGPQGLGFELRSLHQQAGGLDLAFESRRGVGDAQELLYYLDEVVVRIFR